VSLSSMIGAAVGATVLVVLVAIGFYDLGYLVFAISAVLLILLRHRSNIKRLMTGTESKIEEKARPRRVRTRQT
jgi:glycerol-3-phosphate acyltransferase PlsY